MFGKNKEKAKRIYLDYAAATPMDPQVANDIHAYHTEHIGNAVSLHKEGVEAQRTLETARKQVADIIHAHPDEIVFTAGVTQANNIALQGVFAQLEKDGISLADCHAITSVIEHPAVKKVFESLEEKGLQVTYVGVDENGLVNAQEVKEAITKQTVCISIMYANNEIGSIQPLADIAKIARDVRKDRGGKYPFVHTDASQGLQFADIDMRKLDVALLSGSGAKVYGPKGVGFLYVRRGTPIAPVQFGGGQERGINPGTEDVAHILGLAKALELAVEKKEEESTRLRALQQYFISALQEQFPTCVINGAHTLPHIVNVSFPEVDNEELILRLDAAGVAASTRSACGSKDAHTSYVVEALGKNHYPDSSIRFSMGHGTEKEDIDYTIDALAGIFDTIGLLSKA